MSASGGEGSTAEDRFGIVGRVIAGVYHVERVVAEGGFGVVYRAQHGGFRAPIALKCLKVPQHLAAEHQAQFLEYFRAEAEVMFRLSASTPSVVRPLHVDVMTTPTGAFVPFLVLEWLEGETLDSIIRHRRAQKKAPLGLTELVQLLGPVAQALDRAHHFDGPRGKETIIHCDLKPENIFVTDVGGERAVKILDFGVAKVRSAATRAGGASDSVSLFTPAYGAPEQWNPASLGEPGAWTDVWGLALSMVEALVGEPVISGDHTRIMKQVLDRARRPTPRTYGVLLPDAVEAVFARALAVDPRERPRDAGAFWKAIRQALGEAEVAASSPHLAAVIPDLVPVSRASGSMKRVEASGGTFDFDEEHGAGPSLDLDLPPGEPLHRRSLTPPNISFTPAVAEPMPSLGVAPSMGAVAPTPGARSLSPTPSPVGSFGQPAGRRLDEHRPAPGEGGERVPKTPLPKPMLEGGGHTPPAVVMPRRAVPSAPPTLARRLAPGVAMAVSSVLLTLLDHVYASISGEVFSIGPLRTTWIAALLLVGGIGHVAVRLVEMRQDER